MDIPVVTHVRVTAPYTLEVTFQDSKCRTVEMDLSNRSGVFEPLKDPDYFALAYVDEEAGTVCWPNGADLAPERLYEPDPEKWQKLVEESHAAEEKRRSKKAGKKQNARI